MTQAIHWQQAAYWCNENLGEFENLTMPAQGMLIGAYMADFAEGNEWKPMTYNAVLELCHQIHSMHGSEGWGFEK